MEHCDCKKESCNCKKELGYLEFLVRDAKSQYERIPSYWVKAIDGGARVAELAVLYMDNVDSYFQNSKFSECTCKNNEKLKKIGKVVDHYRNHLKYNEEEPQRSALKRCSFIYVAMLVDEEDSALLIDGEVIRCKPE